MPEKIKAMIVEDDRIILEDIVSMIDWSGEGFELVATATNGKLGLAAYETHHPELIITDIQMPVMDGLAMMRAIREQDESASFLILSAFGEFEYAKEAVRLGTDSYLLKAEMTPELLLETLAPIREKIQSRKLVQGMAAQHRLFSMLSASVENGTPSLPSLEDVSAAFRSFYRVAGQQDDWTKQLEWVVRECYSILSLHERGTPCPHTRLPEDVEEWLLSEYRALCQLREFIYERKYSPTIINACQFIEENYGEQQLKISTVANYVGLSSSRLSVLFKQETGQTVNDYITSVRMENAKRLLRSGRYKVYEVSELVGYKTSQYFSQTFYLHTGQAPTDYLKGR